MEVIRLRRTEAEDKKELVKKFMGLVREEKEKLDYLKDSIESVYKWDNKTYKLFLKDALIKLERKNLERLQLQGEILEEENEYEIKEE
ncbi:hypothetical protein COY62_04205 [bacterium (Candidatus Howlettbacteria) CG_4_10_14_0_8_um_filter_40_9]|nr:MAG: hypothetical protein COY62_04205 [bacterium (Candidatus Howlettbacteria) CG_4_10_14_0_8_um_filter_40_9]